MPGITKETFLKAENSKNRDAMLYDMLANIAENIAECKELKADVEGFKTQVTLLKRIFLIIAAGFSAITTWIKLS